MDRTRQFGSLYGLDVINDRKASDGWVLMYNTFNPNAPGPLQNPYFILYNKYRGLMRIFLYTTTQFVASSTYLQDGISIVSNSSTSMLNFIGQDFIDATVNNKMYSQMQPAPSDGSFPLASNKWYMLQYEMAYDSNISKILYNNIQLSWHLNYFNVDNVKLGGTVVGKLNGTLGSPSSASSNFFSALTNTGKAVGTGVLAGVGKEIITNNTINEQTGENKLGLPNNTFKNLATGVSNAISAASGSLPGTIINLLSAVIGGSSGGTTPISFNLNANIELNGTQTSAGSFPSTPISFWVPGSQMVNYTFTGNHIAIDNNIPGDVPLYNKILGVINFSEKPTITIDVDERFFSGPDEPFDRDRIINWTEYTANFPSTIDYSNYLIINPEVLKSANVSIERQDLIFTGYKNGDFIEINPSSLYWQEGELPYYQGDVNHYMPPVNIKFGVRFTIRVQPFDGSPSSVILKTFLLNYEWKFNKKN